MGGGIPPPSPEPPRARPDQGWAEDGGWRGGDTEGNELAEPLPPPRRGFCFFNSVAIACRQLQQQGKASKILIMDWVGPGS